MKKKPALIFVLLFIAVAGGLVWWYAAQVKELRRIGEERPTSIIDFFFPATTRETAETPRQEESVERFDEGALVPRLREVSAEPVAGAAFASTTKGVVARYVLRATGEVRETPVESFETTSLSNAVVPQVVEALWSPKGDRVTLRYLAEDGETVKTFAASFSFSTSTGASAGKLSGVFLEDDVDALAYSPDAVIAYVRRVNGSTITITPPDGGKRTALLSLPISGWLIAPFGSSFAITTKASASVEGFSYTVNAKTGALGSLIASDLGLTVLPNPSGGSILLGNGTLSLTVLEKEKVKALPASTLPEKCVWASRTILYCGVPKNVPALEYPDAWYRGDVSFEDDLWKIDAETGIGEYVAGVSELAGRPVDLVSLSVSPGGSHLLFMNRSDSSLWSFRLGDD